MGGAGGPPACPGCLSAQSVPRLCPAPALSARSGSSVPADRFPVFPSLASKQEQNKQPPAPGVSVL